MADVQLEHGHTRIANRIIEAVLAGPFDAAQVRILLTLARLTFGWNKKSVKISTSKLAEQAGMAPGRDSSGRASGTFRRALRELVSHGIIIELDGGRGRRITTYGIQKDFTRWGRYSSAEARLKAVWQERPENDDRAFEERVEELKDDAKVARPQATLATDPDPATWPADGPSIEESPTDEMARPQAIRWPTDGPLNGPPPGHVDGPKSFDANTSDGRKDKERQEKQTTNNNNRVPAGGEEVRDYAVRLATAVNAGITDRWGEQPNPVVYATGIQLAERCIREGVDIELARFAIVAACGKSRKDRPPTTVSWFENPVFEAHRAAEQRGFNAADKAGPPRSANGLTPIGEVRAPALANMTGMADRQKAEEEEHRAYELARQEAAVAWGKDPANAAEYRAIVLEVNGRWPGFEQSKLIERSRNVDVVLECAKRCGFPEKAAWLKTRAQRSEPPP